MMIRAAVVVYIAILVNIDTVAINLILRLDQDTLGSVISYLELIVFIQNGNSIQRLTQPSFTFAATKFIHLWCF